MQFSFIHNGTSYQYDSALYFDLSTPLRNGEQNVNAYYLDPPKFTPFKAGDFVGSVALGGACNCYDIAFNAHGNGTHTECVGHISKEDYTINQQLTEYHFVARLISVTPELRNGDHVVTKSMIEQLNFEEFDSLIIRTLPNPDSKLTQQYSGTNPPYLEPELTDFLAQNGVKNLIIDLPSVDKEEDGGALLAHHAFWQYPSQPRLHATITELAYITENAFDGLYFLNLHIASFESDASPSKPIIYPIKAV